MTKRPKKKPTTPKAAKTSDKPFERLSTVHPGFWFPCAPVLVFATLLVYWQVTGFDFLWDDTAVNLHKNPYLSDPSLESVLQFWMSPYNGLYAPLTYTIWALIKPLGSQVNGFDPFVYHLLNVLIHILNGLLVFGLLRKMVRNHWAALLGALVFLVHPVQVESVSWVTGFRGLLATCMGLVSIHLYLARAGRGYGLMILALIAFMLALISKPSAVVIPLVIGVIELLHRNENWKTVIIRLAPWFVIAALSVLMTVIAQSTGTDQVDVAWFMRPLVWSDSILFYIGKLIYPVSLAPVYAHSPIEAMDNWWFYLAWIVPVVLFATLWIIREKHGPLLLSFLIFIAGFLPTSGLLLFEFQLISTVSDRYLYLSMLGPSLAVAYGLSCLNYKSVWVAAFLLILALGTWSYAYQVPKWKDPLTLWDHSLAVAPGKSMALNNRAGVYFQQGRLESAMADINMIIESDPDYSQIDGVYANRGAIFFMRKRYPEAVRDFSKAINLDPDNPTYFDQRAAAYIGVSDYISSLQDIRTAESLRGWPNQVLLNELARRGVAIGR